MNWIYLVPLILLIDVGLYIKYWQEYAAKYYYIDYGLSAGMMMVYKLKSTE